MEEKLIIRTPIENIFVILNFKKVPKSKIRVSNIEFDEFLMMTFLSVGKLKLKRHQILLFKNILEQFLNNQLSGIYSEHFELVAITNENGKIVRYEVEVCFNDVTERFDKFRAKNVLSVINGIHKNFNIDFYNYEVEKYTKGVRNGNIRD